MTNTITITDPEFAAMFESTMPTMGDIPRAVCLGRTEDGRNSLLNSNRTEFPPMGDMCYVRPEVAIGQGCRGSKQHVTGHRS